MQCPGQDTRYWKPGAVFETTCPKCGGEMEFFKDEASRRCKKCGERMLNPKMDFGCASYCQYAEQCFGSLPQELLAGREDLFKDRVAIAVKRYFGKDFKRIGHATRVARHAEQIGKQERGGNLAVILSAAYFHDIGYVEAKRKYQSAESHLQEQEGPAVARQILVDLKASPELIDEVCDIVGHHHPRPEETVNFKVLYDADVLANLEEEHKEQPLSQAELDELLGQKFLTQAGRELAAKELAKCCVK